MLTAKHTAESIAMAEQAGALRPERVVPAQSPVTLHDRLSDVDELCIILMAASPARARSFALSMHERLCERGDFDHADVWEAWLRAIQDAALLNSPQ